MGSKPTSLQPSRKPSTSAKVTPSTSSRLWWNAWRAKSWCVCLSNWFLNSLVTHPSCGEIPACTENRKSERQIEPRSFEDHPVCFDRRRYHISNGREICGECLWEPVIKCYLVSLQTDNGVSHRLRGAPGHRRCHSEGLTERLVNEFPFEPCPSPLNLLLED